MEVFVSELQQVFNFDLSALVKIYTSSTSTAFQYQIVELIDEAKRTFNARCRRSTIILASEILHRVNCELITHLIIKEGFIQHTKSSGRNITLRREDTYGKDIAEELNLNETIEFLYRREIINEGTSIEMHLLRYIRNGATHAEVPGMLSQESRTNVARTEQEFMDTISGKRPLPPKEYLIFFPLKGKEVKYMIDQIILEINLDEMEDYKMRLPAVSLRILLLCMEKVASAFA
ncbi:MAG: hypothetical protein WCH05_10680 [Chlorobiaceae bacterium]